MPGERGGGEGEGAYQKTVVRGAFSTLSHSFTMSMRNRSVTTLPRNRTTPVEPPLEPLPCAACLAAVVARSSS